MPQMAKRVAILPKMTARMAVMMMMVRMVMMRVQRAHVSSDRGEGGGQRRRPREAARAKTPRAKRKPCRAAR
eukprot:4942782-Pleurochrysis_carterae.AAC.1